VNLVDLAAAANPMTESWNLRTEQTMNHRQPIIVILDPDADRATALSCRLDHNGYHVFRRAYAIDALECVQQYQADLFLSEVDLLDLEAPELLRLIRERSPSTRVLFITRPGSSPRSSDDGSPGLMEPPFVPKGVDEVLRAVDRLLEGVPVRTNSFRA
jgi:DNA-binding NtrC family response regulator